MRSKKKEREKKKGRWCEIACMSVYVRVCISDTLSQPTASCYMTLLSLPWFTLPLRAFLLDSPSVCHFRGKMHSLDLGLILLLNAGRVAAQEDGKVCYILDGILIVYGIVLTVLYCRLKMRSSGDKAFSEKREGDIYQDLGRRDVDTYDTLHPGKKKPLA